MCYGKQSLMEVIGLSNSILIIKVLSKVNIDIYLIESLKKECPGKNVFI